MVWPAVSLDVCFQVENRIWRDGVSLHAWGNVVDHISQAIEDELYEPIPW